MNPIIQLNPTIPVITPRGKGTAIGWIDYSSEHDLFWVVFQDDTGECWTWNNKEIRAQENLTMGRAKPKMPTVKTEDVVHRVPCGDKTCHICYDIVHR